MIQINLLDPASSRGGRGAAKAVKAGPAAPFAGPARSGGGILAPFTLVLVLALNGTLGYFAWSNIHTSRVAYEQVKAEETKLKSEINKKMTEAEQIRKYREVVANQMDVLKSLDPPDRILWCEKLNMISNLVPPNVFLAEIKIDENVKMVETEQSKAAREKWAKSKTKDKTKEPPMVQKPVINYIVRLTGLALGKDNVEQMQNVTAFHKAISEYTEARTAGQEHRFMDGFQKNIEFESVEATTYEGTPVNKFIFKLTTVPMGENSAPDPAATASKSVAKISLNQLARTEEKNLAAK